MAEPIAQHEERAVRRNVVLNVFDGPSSPKGKASCLGRPYCLFALRTVLVAALGIIAGWSVERILASMAPPDAFSLLFAISFGVMMGSYVLPWMLDEREGRVSKPRSNVP